MTDRITHRSRIVHLWVSKYTPMRPIQLSILLLCTAPAIAQSTINSVANGLFYFPATWDCSCIPTPHTGQNVVISHVVTMNEDIGVYGGDLTITAQGQLVEDAVSRAIHVNEGGNMLIEGEITVSSLWVQDGTLLNSGSGNILMLANNGLITNQGDMIVPDSMWNDGLFLNQASLTVGSFLNSDTLDNSGSITGVDSISNTGTLINAADGTLDCDSVLNIGDVQNLGSWTSQAMLTSGSFNNAGTLVLNDLMNTLDLTNSGEMSIGGSVTNMGTFNNLLGGNITVNEYFLNASELPPVEVGTALFNAHGDMQVNDSWFNFAIMGGTAPGSITVQDTTLNAGVLQGDWDLCDLSPTVSQLPNIDLNFGTVGDSLTFCFTTAIPEASSTSLRIHPNPASDLVLIENRDRPIQQLRITDLSGRLLHKIAAPHSGPISIDVSRFSIGIYLITVDGSAPIKLVIE